MKQIITASLFFVASFISAQDPVSWAFAIETDGAQSWVTMEATIEEGWHIYGLELDNDEGPLPTVLEFNEQNVTWGDLLIPEPKTKYDEMFMMNVTYYETKVKFTRIYTTTVADHVSGSVDFMVCNDETCLPPTLVPFKLNLKPDDN